MPSGFVRDAYFVFLIRSVVNKDHICCILKKFAMNNKNEQIYKEYSQRSRKIYFGNCYYGIIIGSVYTYRESH